MTISGLIPQTLDLARRPPPHTLEHFTFLPYPFEFPRPFEVFEGCPFSTEASNETPSNTFFGVARAEAAASELQADPLGLAATPIDRDPLDLAQWGSQSLGTAGPQLCLRPRKKHSVSVKARKRGASGTRPVALVPSEA